MDSHTIPFNGSEIEVNGTYRKGYPETRDTPEESHSFEFTSVIYKGIDVTDLILSFDSNALDRIEDLILTYFY